jgi:hypothetical protein
MAQQNIDFGSFPDDPNADAIRAAFQSYRSTVLSNPAYL